MARALEVSLRPPSPQLDLQPAVVLRRADASDERRSKRPAEEAAGTSDDAKDDDMEVDGTEEDRQPLQGAAAAASGREPHESRRAKRQRRRRATSNQSAAPASAADSAAQRRQEQREIIITGRQRGRRRTASHRNLIREEALAINPERLETVRERYAQYGVALSDDEAEYMWQLWQLANVRENETHSPRFFVRQAGTGRIFVRSNDINEMYLKLVDKVQRYVEANGPTPIQDIIEVIEGTD